MKSEEDFVTVYTSNGPLAAEVVKGKLESDGIPALLKYESAGRALGLTIDGLGEVAVLVTRKDAVIALGILNEKQGSSGAGVQG